MGVEMTGFEELIGEIVRMGDQFVDAGGEGLNKIVKAGAEPILQQAILNAPERPGSGVLKRSLKIVMKKKGSRSKARIGVQKGSDGYYATFVEYGHKGPHPAGPHPFLAPAYDAKQEEAFGIIKQQLADKLR